MITTLKTFYVFATFLSLSVDATFLYGSWKLAGNDDGWVRVNGEKVTSRKVKGLGMKGNDASTVWNMGLIPAHDRNNYGFEFAKRKGKAFLNVQLLQNNMGAPRIIGSLLYKKVPD